jgi:ArsR family transcriptional regulator, arsenate/arsenite/antimonite-responsive transcriptional repressor / arsenate reductase (thioredoxin)
LELAAVDVTNREQRAMVFRALGDVNRLTIVELLAIQDLSPDALATAVDLPANLLAHHLKVLQQAGIVTRHRSQNDKRRTYIHLNGPAVDGLVAAPDLVAAPRVVFVCTQNSARSVLAEAVWRGVSDVPSSSAGTRPAAQINPRARTAARRAGLSLASDVPRSIDDVLRRDDVIISVCDAVNEELGGLPNTRLHWSIADPADVDTDAAFEVTVDDLRDRVARAVPTVRRVRRGRWSSTDQPCPD